MIEQVQMMSNENNVQNQDNQEQEYTVREAKISDAEQLISLYNQLTKCPELTDEQLHHYFDNVLQSAFHYVFVVANKEKVVACTTLLIEQKMIHGFKSVGHIEDVVSDESVRGQGYGKMVVQHAMNFAFSMNCYKVILDCEEKNIQFYEKCGLKVVGTEMAKYM